MPVDRGAQVLAPGSFILFGLNTPELVADPDLLMASSLYLAAADLRAATERSIRSVNLKQYGRSEIGRYLLNAQVLLYWEILY